MSNVRQGTGRPLKNFVAVNKSAAENKKTSIVHRPQQLKISRSTTQRILTKDIHYKRRQFIQWVMEQK